MKVSHIGMFKILFNLSESNPCKIEHEVDKTCWKYPANAVDADGPAAVPDLWV